MFPTFLSLHPYAIHLSFPSTYLADPLIFPIHLSCPFTCLAHPLIFPIHLSCPSTYLAHPLILPIHLSCLSTYLALPDSARCLSSTVHSASRTHGRASRRQLESGRSTKRRWTTFKRQWEHTSPRWPPWRTKRHNIDKKKKVLSRSQLKAKFFDFLDENGLIFVVFSLQFQRLGRDFGVLFWPQQYVFLTSLFIAV